ncbi:MAG TPA: hypothetical protein P5175_12140 [Anaerohalosphaeraceae bacterium]|nr:hypothetical protein [Anaerohalosphaeraceae bacterium]HOM75615.1 hypothetical protein [Anaerohalosphaeraceae bacterium]HPC65247.1 hypothetical protein [Anaerohalosphaeraceae bacterium]HRS72584.1 hypothetical protein [Anaerohalosphaeraceae bacterium]
MEQLQALDNRFLVYGREELIGISLQDIKHKVVDFPHGRSKQLCGRILEQAQVIVAE